MGVVSSPHIQTPAVAEESMSKQILTPTAFSR